MIIDLSDIIKYKEKFIDIVEDITIPIAYLESSRIQKLKDLKFSGRIVPCGDIYQLTGVLSGIMSLLDDVTLEEVNYSFKTDIEYELTENTEDNDDICKILQNSIDIIPILWQNIILEVPSKVRKDNNTYHLKGEGWQLMTEEEYLDKDE